jgi:hypothetical protein
MIPIIGAALVAALLALYVDQRGQRKATQKLAAEHYARIGEVLEELVSLRSTLVASGAAERAARLPAPRSVPAPALPSVERKVVSVTRDDDPVHTRTTLEAPAPPGWGEARQKAPEPASAPADASDDPPSTKPSTKPSTSQSRRRERAPTESAESSPIFETRAALRARIEAAEDERERARARGELAPLPRMDEDDGRPTGEVLGDDEQTRVFSKRSGDADALLPGIRARRAVPATMRPPPHAPPRPRSERPTLFDGMLRAPPADLPAPAGAERDRDGGAA